MNIKCRLKVVFAERDIKQRAFAEEHDIKYSTLSALVNNKQKPSLEMAYRISDALGLSVEEIWVKEGEKE